MYEVYLTIDEIEHKILEEPEEIRLVATLFLSRRTKKMSMFIMYQICLFKCKTKILRNCVREN